MLVKAVAITQPITEDCESPQELLAWFARVSNVAGQSHHNTGKRLIRSLIKRKEWSPLEMVNLVFEIETQRDISHQLIRHWSLRPQEFSQRYAPVAIDKSYRRLARFQDPTDKQRSRPAGVGDYDTAVWWDGAQAMVLSLVDRIYGEALRRGLSRDLVRSILPEGLTPTRLYVNGSIRSWIHYTQARDYDGAQIEHQLIARKVKEVLLQHFPVFVEVL